MTQVLLAIFLLFSCVCSSSVNFHDRRLYYGEDDNRCIPGGNDLITLTILFDDRNAVTKTIFAGTVCNYYSIRYINMITPHKSTAYSQYHDGPEPYFDQLIIDLDYRVSRFLDVVTGIFMRSRVRNPATFDQNTYECQVDGDGIVQHFGPVGTIPAPSMRIYCQRVNTNPQIQSS